MIQRRWIELIKDYVRAMINYSGKTNDVSDAKMERKVRICDYFKELVHEIDSMKLQVRTLVQENEQIYEI